MMIGKHPSAGRMIALFGLLILAWKSPVEATPPIPPFETLGAGLHDFDWVRDRYSQNPVERTRWRNLLNWAGRRAAERTHSAEAAVAQFGVRLNVSNVDGCYGDEACEWVIRTEAVAADSDSWEEFAAAWTEARDDAAGYMLAVRHAQLQLRQSLDPSILENEIKIRFLEDQMLRAALADSSLTLSPLARRLFRLVIGLQVGRVDRANTEWLRQIVRSSGWPEGPNSSGSAVRPAWFLVLHARHDPAFRLEILRLLENLVRAGRMSGANFATRYDHIMWETAGVQRYGTKGDCVDGQFVTPDIQDERQVAQLRRQVGLPTLEEQAQMMGSACRQE